MPIHPFLTQNNASWVSCLTL